jgi:hypothetical protein
MIGSISMADQTSTVMNGERSQVQPRTAKAS